ncbi:hypothetical protein ISN44_As13g027380 [Arabidopsis suecica]|uniref:Uncharacterized protein n=1 Tax=Arabidopsis suecica TaxID=45249 RepID=A0A8T1Y7M6_ARASU|nr:hypothetical protein ISN44_As13g027380 [Arabidopsis suecica]
MRKMTLKLVFLVALIAFCFASSDAREMPKEEGDCIGKCPPTPPPMNDPREMPKEEGDCIGKCPPTPPPMDDAREMPKEEGD